MFLFLIVLMALRGLAGNAMAAGIVMPASAAMHMAHAPEAHGLPTALDQHGEAFQEFPHHAAGTDHGTHPHTPEAPEVSAGHALHAEPFEASTMSSWQPPCHGQTAAAPAHGSDCGTTSQSSTHAHDGGCSACGICHSAMLTPALADPSRAALPRAPLPMAERRFASALAEQAIKPPIS